VDAADGNAPEALEALVVAALTDEVQAIPLPSPGWDTMLRDEFAEPSAPCDDHWEIERLLQTAGRDAPGSASAQRRERAARVTLAMQHWRGPAPTADVEHATGIPAGRLATLAEAVGWAVQMMGRLGREAGWPSEQWRGMLRLGESVAAGVPETGLRLHELHVPGMGRGHILALLEAGITSRSQIAHADPGTLERLLGPRLAARAMVVACGVPADLREKRTPTPRRIAGPATRSAGPPRGGVPKRLVIEADRPDRVLLDGEPIALRPAEFRLLRVLAEAPRACVAYEAIYQGIWGDESFVEPAQIYSHRSRLGSKFADAAPDGADILRTIPKRGIMLDLPPERVRVT
jgi:hypothetical protein